VVYEFYSNKAHISKWNPQVPKLTSIALQLRQQTEIEIP
ncbi:MAG: hypothetical protein ACI82O_003664, partial [Patiriisocius sp.]